MTAVVDKISEYMILKLRLLPRMCTNLCVSQLQSKRTARIPFYPFSSRATQHATMSRLSRPTAAISILR